jgi:excisionase family DNA binding protein
MYSDACQPLFANAARTQISPDLRLGYAKGEDEMAEHTTTGTRLLHDLDSVQETLGIGRSTAFGLIKSKQLRSIKVGRKRMVSDQSLREFIADQESDA